MPTLAEAFRLLRRHRDKARTKHNTFARELEEICTVHAGKPLK